jgi:TonB family protein
MKIQKAAKNKQAMIAIYVIALPVFVILTLCFVVWAKPDIPMNLVSAIYDSKSLQAVTGSYSKAATPTGDPGIWVMASDYPARALQEKRSGRTDIDLLVSSSGIPLLCSVDSSSGHADLDDAACAAVMNRARFNPALARSGIPVMGGYKKSVYWQLPTA